MSRPTIFFGGPWLSMCCRASFVCFFHRLQLPTMGCLQKTFRVQRRSYWEVHSKSWEERLIIRIQDHVWYRRNRRLEGRAIGAGGGGATNGARPPSPGTG